MWTIVETPTSTQIVFGSTILRTLKDLLGSVAGSGNLWVVTPAYAEEQLKRRFCKSKLSVTLKSWAAVVVTVARPVELS